MIDTLEYGLDDVLVVLGVDGVGGDVGGLYMDICSVGVLLCIHLV